MCDYSLQSVATRSAKVGDKLVTTNFSSGTRGFAPVGDPMTAVCCLPGTEIAFDEEIKTTEGNIITDKVAIFRQLNKEQPFQHHDALELPNGTSLLLTYMKEGQTATVLQLPAAPRNEQEAKDQQRLEVVG